MATLLAKRSLPLTNLSKSQILRKTPCRTGYIVLLPEAVQVPHQTLESFPSQTGGLPDIESLTTEKCISAISKHSLELELGLWKLEDKLKDGNAQPQNVFDDILDPLEKLSTPLESTWGLMKTLFLTKSNLMPEKEYMSIHERARRVRSQKFNSKAIYSACKNADLSDLSEEEKRVINKYVLEGSLNGLHLNDHNDIKLKNILNKISQAKSAFRGKVQIATKSFHHRIYDNSIIRDFPQDLLQAMAIDRGGPWVVTLQPNVYNQFLEYCPIRDLRWNTWQANVQRCSIGGDKALETSTHIEDLRSLRMRQANVLGFENFAHMSMQTKMAGSIGNVEKMIERLLRKAYPAQKQELEGLQTFAEERGFEGSLQIWDIPYWKRKQLRTLYCFEEETVREYFPFPHVLEQMFALCEHLFGVHIVKDKSTKAQFYHIVDSSTKGTIASFILDPYARSEEKLGAEGSGWMVALRNRSILCELQPAAALLFNFRPPRENKPSLLSFREVHVLFQKFGLALQHLLTTAKYSDVAGLSNVEWDTVEVCSNFMTHWLYHSSTVKNLSSHYETKETLPQEILASLQQLRQLMAGYELCQQLYLAALDLKLHSSKKFWLDIVRELWPLYFNVPLQKYDAHPCSFSAIFSEEWAAAYYSHIWAQIIAADVFSAFEEAGLDNTEELKCLGHRLRSTFLELGGGCHPGEVFRRFRGRDPSPNALLWSLGLKKVPNQTFI